MNSELCNPYYLLPPSPKDGSLVFNTYFEAERPIRQKKKKFRAETTGALKTLANAGAVGAPEMLRTAAPPGTRDLVLFPDLP